MSTIQIIGDTELRTAERLVKIISIFCILGWRVFWMTMLNRTSPESTVALVFTKTEVHLLNRLVPNKCRPCKRSVSNYLIKLAKLGGYLERSSDSPPGNMVIWRGLSRLTDIEIGFALAQKNVGN